MEVFAGVTLDVKDVSTEGHTKGHALYDSPHNRCPECANPEKRKLAGDCQGLVEGRSQVLTLNGFKVSLAWRGVGIHGGLHDQGPAFGRHRHRHLPLFVFGQSCLYSFRVDV